MFRFLLSLLALLSLGSFLMFGSHFPFNPFQDKTYQVYFYYGESIVPVKRKLNNKEHVLKQAMQALEQGPTIKEKRKGYSTLWPEKLLIKRMELNSGVLDIYFSPELLDISGGNSVIEGLIKQIVYTATQFKDVEKVRFRIEGRRGNRLALGGEGYIIDAPLGRRDFE